MIVKSEQANPYEKGSAQHEAFRKGWVFAQRQTPYQLQNEACDNAIAFIAQRTGQKTDATLIASVREGFEKGVTAYQTYHSS